jgi:hypothetical protein
MSLKGSSISHTRTSTHAQGHRLDDEDYGREGLGIDYDNVDSRALPHKLKTVLFHAINFEEENRLFIKLETAKSAYSTEWKVTKRLYGNDESIHKFSKAMHDVFSSLQGDFSTINSEEPQKNHF